tara:strand:+ start:100 stop:1281 length:1182 start_codon:yes stop_codon:yes gene_type:complete
MIFFSLPNVNIEPRNIECITCDEDLLPFISFSLNHYLTEMKFKIEKIESKWDIYKKYTNPYEYINTIIPNKNKCVSKYKPLSRSYFKMIEIIDTFNLIRIEDKKIKTFHLAEGPGGFIEAFVNKRNNDDDVYYGMTLLDDEEDMNIPSWKKSQQFLNKHSNVVIENGIKKNGDILDFDNFTYIIKTYGSSMNIVTGDGGFDFSNDFNKQETSISKLLFAQLCYALFLQKKNGSFILKMFDCFLKNSVDILYILSGYYNEVYICKPQTSRYANSEKYIVCKGFCGLNETSKTYLISCFQSMLLNKSQNIMTYIKNELPTYFITKVEEYNAIFGQQQIENINNTLLLLEHNKNDKIQSIMKNHIQKCIFWCNKYNVPYNTIIEENVFLKSYESDI